MKGWSAAAAALVLVVAWNAPRAADPSQASPQDSHPEGGSQASSVPDGGRTGGKAGGGARFYVPPAPDSRLAGGRVGGGTRSTRANPCDAKVSVIAPEDHAGLTLEAQPTLYYFLSSDTRCQVTFVLNDRRQVPPLVEKAVSGSPEAGLHAIRISDFEVSLERDVEYDWFVQLKASPKDRDPATFSGGQVRRVAVPAGLEATGSDAERARVLGQHAIWYDSVDALSRAIDANPADTALRAQRAALFASQDLDVAAARDRGGSAK